MVNAQMLGQILTMAAWGVGNYFAQEHTDGKGVMDVLTQIGAPQATMQLFNPAVQNPDTTPNPMLKAVTDQLAAEKARGDALQLQVAELTKQIADLVAALNGPKKDAA